MVDQGRWLLIVQVVSEQSVHFHFLYSGTCLIRNFLDPTKFLYTNECFTLHFNPSNPTIW